MVRNQLSMLFLLLLCPWTTTCLHAQFQIDTVVFEQTDPMQIKIVKSSSYHVLQEVHKGIRTDVPLSPEELFVRSMKKSDLHSEFLLNRVQYFDGFGILIREEALVNPIKLEMPYIFKPAPVSEFIDGFGQQTVDLPTGKISLDRKVVLEGQIGSEVRTDLAIKAYLSSEERYTLEASDQRLTYPKDIVLKGHQSSIIPLSSILPVTIERITLSLDDGSGTIARILVELNGHDLKDIDFAIDPKEAKTVVLKKSRPLVIKSDGRDKLLRLMRDNQVLENFSNGKKRTGIDLAQYPLGTYLIESLDLGSNQVRYAKVEIE